MKENKVGNTIISKYDYTVNALGQRSTLSQTGTGFASVRSIAWGYDAYGQLTSAESTVTGQAITVNNLATTRQGTDFRRELGFDNSGGQRWETVTTNGGSPLTSHHHIPAASTIPGYDLDGNLTSDGQWTYTWDAENRLTSATRSPAAITAGAPYRMITYRYDSQSRQIFRSVVTTAGGSSATTYYLYDGWNVIAEYTGTTLAKTYLWGLDFSGSMQGAGGVGGLLSNSDIATATTHYPCYDGNGNVRKLLHSTTLAPTAIYDYGPFGELTRATGSYALSNPYRFSTKPQDADTSFLYYTNRWYDSNTGRWTSRDLIEENGGVNLYGFVRNSSINHIDLLGLEVLPFTNDGMTPSQDINGGWHAPAGTASAGQFVPSPSFNISPSNTVTTPGNTPAPSLPSGRGQGASGAMSGVQSILNSVADAASRAGAERKCKELKAAATSTAGKEGCNSCIVVIGNHNVMQGGSSSPRFSVLLSVSYYAGKKCSDHDLSPKTEPGFTQGPGNSYTDTEMTKKYGDGSLVNPVKQSPYCLSL